MTIKIVQISDIHLTADPQGQAFGCQPERGLQAVLAHIHRHAQDADLIIASGDLTQDGADAAYQRLHRYFEALPAPVYCIPGNHDEAQKLRQFMHQGRVQTLRQVLIKDWQIVFIDSAVRGRKEGELCQAELAAVEASLAQAHARHALLVLHHHPLPIHSPWMDDMMLTNPEALFALIHRYPQVRGVIYGHIHQEAEQQHEGVWYWGAPATSAQLKPFSLEYALDSLTPGYRWLALGGQGEINTGICRVVV